jgi:heptosyltransferase-1
MRVLIVRLSSMGDLVQTLPAVTDAAKAYPDIRFDWVVDEAFAQVPSWHRKVENVLPSAFRRWGANLKRTARNGEIRSFLQRLRSFSYEAIVDVQGEWKSATIARLARGQRRGYDGASVHEWGAHLLYRRSFTVPKGQHSMRRMRRLLSEALSYSYREEDLDYGIDPTKLINYPMPAPEPYIVLVHSTSWTSKNWPEEYWRELNATITRAGYRVVLPWGTEAERERAIRIAGDHKDSFVLPPLSISEKASVISRAVATVGLDTGLSHIAAALGVPSVTLYGATDPLLVGATGRMQLHIASAFECVKCHEVSCTFKGPSEIKPACFAEITPQRVWGTLQSVLPK